LIERLSLFFNKVMCLERRRDKAKYRTALEDIRNELVEAFADVQKDPKLLQIKGLNGDAIAEIGLGQINPLTLHINTPNKDPSSLLETWFSEHGLTVWEIILQAAPTYDSSLSVIHCPAGSPTALQPKYWIDFSDMRMRAPNRAPTTANNLPITLHALSAEDEAILIALAYFYIELNIFSKSRRPIVGIQQSDNAIEISLATYGVLYLARNNPAISNALLKSANQQNRAPSRYLGITQEKLSLADIIRRLDGRAFVRV
jgi:hypothetical protein